MDNNSSNNNPLTTSFTINLSISPNDEKQHLSDDKTKQLQFVQWKKDFLDQFEMYLPQVGTKLARQAYQQLQQALYQLLHLLQKIEFHLRNGSLSSSKSCTVAGRYTLTEFARQIAIVSTWLDTIIPGTTEKEEQVGYNKYHLGCVLLQGGFQEYASLVTCNEIFHHLQEHNLKNVADRTLWEETHIYHLKLQKLIDVMSDLGLYNNKVMICKQATAGAATSTHKQDEAQAEIKQKSNEEAVSTPDKHVQEKVDPEERFAAAVSSTLMPLVVQEEEQEKEEIDSTSPLTAAPVNTLTYKKKLTRTKKKQQAKKNNNNNNNSKKQQVKKDCKQHEEEQCDNRSYASTCSFTSLGIIEDYDDIDDIHDWAMTAVTKRQQNDNRSYAASSTSFTSLGIIEDYDDDDDEDNNNDDDDDWATTAVTKRQNDPNYDPYQETERLRWKFQHYYVNNNKIDPTNNFLSTKSPRRSNQQSSSQECDNNDNAIPAIGATAQTLSSASKDNGSINATNSRRRKESRGSGCVDRSLLRPAIFRDQSLDDDDVVENMQDKQQACTRSSIPNSNGGGGGNARTHHVNLLRPMIMRGSSFGDVNDNDNNDDDNDNVSMPTSRHCKTKRGGRGLQSIMPSQQLKATNDQNGDDDNDDNDNLSIPASRHCKTKRDGRRPQTTMRSQQLEAFEVALLESISSRNNKNRSNKRDDGADRLQRSGMLSGASVKDYDNDNDNVEQRQQIREEEVSSINQRPKALDCAERSLRPRMLRRTSCQHEGNSSQKTTTSRPLTGYFSPKKATIPMSRRNSCSVPNGMTSVNGINQTIKTSRRPITGYASPYKASFAMPRRNSCSYQIVSPDIGYGSFHEPAPKIVAPFSPLWAKNQKQQDNDSAVKQQQQTLQAPGGISLPKTATNVSVLDSTSTRIMMDKKMSHVSRDLDLLRMTDCTFESSKDKLISTANKKGKYLADDMGKLKHRFGEHGMNNDPVTSTANDNKGKYFADDMSKLKIGEPGMNNDPVNSSNISNMMMPEDVSSSGGDEEDRTATRIRRQEKCYMWYARLGQPNRELFKRKVAALPEISCGGTDAITDDDIDSLPWICNGAILNVHEMNKLFLTASRQQVKSR